MAKKKDKRNNPINFTQNSDESLSFRQKQTVERVNPSGFGYRGSNVMRKKSRG